MSVICQNFVQNTWRKDLCSNCFKSETDHISHNSLFSKERKTSTPQTSTAGSRYVPQVAPIYQTKGIISQIPWRSLLNDRKQPAKYDGNFNDTARATRLRETNRAPSIGKSSPIRMNGHDKVCDPHQGILKTARNQIISGEQKSSVGFKEESPQVIGYGGETYDSEEDQWESGSDRDSICLDSFDVTEEDKAISKITKENTEFNAANLTLEEFSSLNANDLYKDGVTSNCDRTNSSYCESRNEINQALNDKGCRDILLIKRDLNTSSPYVSTFARNNLFQKEDFLNGNESEVNGLSPSNNKLSNGTTLHYPFKNRSNKESDLHLSNSPHKTSEPISLPASLNSPYKANSHLDCSLAKKSCGHMSLDSDSNPETETNESISSSICDFSEPIVKPRTSFLHGKAVDDRTIPGLSPRPVEHENTSTSSGDQYTSDSDTQNASASSLESSDSGSPKKKTYKINTLKTNEESSRAFSRVSNDVALPSADQLHTNHNHVERAPNKAKSHHKKVHRLQRQDAIATPELPTPSTDEEHSVHYAVTGPITEYDLGDSLSATNHNLLDKMAAEEKVNHYAEGSIDGQVHASNTNNPYDPASKVSRETKLAALALELEQVRRHSSGDSESSKSPQTPKTPPGELPSRQSLPPPSTAARNTCNNKTHVRQSSLTTLTPSSNSGTETKPDNSFITPNISRLSVPDSRQDKKKGKFSLKKLLRRHKEPGRYHTIGGISSTMQVNPKAWKQNEYDISKLRLEIIHPMDLVNGNNSASLPSLDNSATEDAESSLEVVCTQQTSPSVGITGAINNYPLKKSSSADGCVPGEMEDNLDVLQTSTEGWSLTPKKSAGPQTPVSQTETSKSSLPPASGNNRTYASRPPKPPPPPRGPRSLLPANQNQSKSAGISSRANVPARPPPPKVADSKKGEGQSSVVKQNKLATKNEPSQQKHIGSDYANLGNVRSLIAPKKPERSVNPTNHTPKGKKSEVHSSDHGLESEENDYEMVEILEEEDHYTYLDEGEIDDERNEQSCETQNKHLLCTSDLAWLPSDSCSQTPSTTDDGHNSTPPPPYSDNTCPDSDDRKPWFSLEESYAAIASANYEALVDLVTSAVQDRGNQLKSNGAMQWNDFELESEHPVKMLDDKVIYNATFKHGSKAGVTLLVTTQKVHTSHSRTTFQFPLLCLFSDYLPRHYVTQNSSQTAYSDVTKVSIFVLQRSEISTIEHFLYPEIQRHPNTHSMFLRDVCFVLLQLIHTLKMFQADGTEEIEYDLKRMLIARTDREQPPSLVFLPHDRNYLGASDLFMTHSTNCKTSLCQVALRMMFYLLQVSSIEDLSTECGKEFVSEVVVQMFAAVGKVLTQEKASSLSHAKNLLEYMLWGPVDVVKSADDPNNVNAIFQRWLDLQRAQNLKSLVSNLYRTTKRLAILNVYEEYQLLFLMQANVKSLKDLIAKL